MPPEPLDYRGPDVLGPASRWRRWASAALIACLLGLAPALLLLEGANIVTREQDVRRGSVIYVGGEARWAGVGYMLWGAAILAYGWFRWRRHVSTRLSRRAIGLARSAFLLLVTAGATCQGMAFFKRQARQDQEAADRLRALPLEVREKAQQILDPGHR